MKNKIIYLLLFCTCLALPGQAQQFKTFEVGKKTFLLNGEPFIVKAAELHYTRIPQPYWEHRIKMCKALWIRFLQRKYLKVQEFRRLNPYM